ncbi:hypothetical protein GOP56_07920 [Brevibacillus sp. 7WMA2]|uniref:hypothetical protein n=1 Tax=Brevibacillus TaxID=55080 RepID=UPI0013A747EB|nr:MULTISPECIES: hypothetical protein [Brevibacillus]MCR8994544.1 hypothetical protein [Brevibacillus laterosporus]QIC05523.1 hypothetical protein GOP56_07920 [Brevibacillus sp. 7WMA2]WPS86361.1 hypothetical protein SMD22_17865 [Brevibacillus halotolerans]
MPNKPVDYVWVADDKFWEAREFYKLRPNTKVLEEISRDKIMSLQGFIEAVRQNSQRNPPHNLIVVAHADIIGGLKIKLFDDDDEEWVNSEQLLKVINDSEKKKKLMIPRGVHFLHVRGCQIGLAKGFLKLLRKAIGGNVHVSGPKHIILYGPFSWNGKQIGYQEYMMYGFRLLRTKKLSGPEEVRNDLRKKPFHFYDNTPVPKKFWDTIDIPNPDKETFFEVKVISPVTQTGFLLQARWFFYQIYYPGINKDSKERFKLEGKDPGIDKLKMEALRLRRDLLKKFLCNQKWFPMEYQRFGYRTAKEFMDGWNWDISPLEGHPDELKYGGSRFDYTIWFPVTNLSPKNKDLLFLNFNPLPGVKKYKRINKLIDPENDKNRWFYEIV